MRRDFSHTTTTKQTTEEYGSLDSPRSMAGGGMAETSAKKTTAKRRVRKKFERGVM
jgi:hypothetical protein